MRRRAAMSCRRHRLRICLHPSGPSFGSIVWPVSVVHVMARAKCELSAVDCKALLKKHVRSLEDRRYTLENMDTIVFAYVGFLETVAAKTRRLNASVLKPIVAKEYGFNDRAATQFAESMQKALSYSLAKLRQMTSGIKVTEQVKRILLAAKFISPSGNKCLDEESLLPILSPASSRSTSALDATPDCLKDANSVRNLYGLSPLKKQRQLCFVPSTPLDVLSSQESQPIVKVASPIPVYMYTHTPHRSIEQTAEAYDSTGRPQREVVRSRPEHQGGNCSC